uniref:BTB domain-containing protein n=1 Tax=Panagrolaimus davidi TaxID=227884 RepID=A0A914PZM5_9BILA
MENIFEQECNFGMWWIIPREKFDTFKPQSCYQSDTFKASIPGVSYCLRLYPNGILNADGKTYVYLELSKGMTESVQCDFKISIRCTSFAKNYSKNFEESGTWGAMIANKNQIFANPNFFGENRLIIELEGTMKGKGLKFGAMFEKDENSVIKLPEFCFSTIKTVIEFCYDKDIKNSINPNNAIEFLRFSDKFEMDDLKDTVETCLIQYLSDENVCQLASTSVEFNSKQLRECCVCFLLLKKSDEISNNKNWEKIDKKICQEIIQRALTFVSKNSFDFC